MAVETSAFCPLAQLLRAAAGWWRRQWQVVSRRPSPASSAHHQAEIFQGFFSKAAGNVIPEKQLRMLIGDIQYVIIWINKCQLPQKRAGSIAEDNSRTFWESMEKRVGPPPPTAGAAGWFLFLTPVPCFLFQLHREQKNYFLDSCNHFRCFYFALWILRQGTSIATVCAGFTSVLEEF